MSSGWSWFVIIGTIGSLLWYLYMLFANRRTSGKETTGHSYDGIEELDSPMPMWWVGLFVATVIYAGLYLIYYPGLGNFAGTAGWTSVGQWQEEVDRHTERFAPLYASLAELSEEELSSDRRALQVGRRLFLNNCATCHGVTARGTFGFPNLTDDEWIWGGEFSAIQQTISNGRTGIMPPWGAALGDAGVADVTQHVLQLAGRDHDEAAAARGAAQYQIFCVACHQADGSGNPQLGAPRLNNDSWLYGSSADEIAFTIRHGRNGNMPSFAEFLAEDKVRILAGYVRSLGDSASGTGSPSGR
ncbi:MAG: cytochrome-c oxidase, cbb3-type subunit III [Pseudomonadales bacterium]|nr:cytochrome-c oxidase, cbb3-type subunit III [Pseudomonadales bacterium]